MSLFLRAYTIMVHECVFLSTLCAVGEDYYSLSQDITFEPGERLKTIGIEILNDDSLEAREDILLFLFVFDTSTSALLPGNRTRAVLVILDDEFRKLSWIPRYTSDKLLHSHKAVYFSHSVLLSVQTAPLVYGLTDSLL